MNKYFLTLLVVLSMSVVLKAQNKLESTGNVGIGTTTPLSPLHIKSASDALVTFQASDDFWMYTNWLSSSGERKAWMGFDSTLKNFSVSLENGANKFTIPNGNVGIGTTTPSSKLDVVGIMTIGDGGGSNMPFKIWSGGSGGANHMRIGTDYGHYGDAALEIYQNYNAGTAQEPGRVVVNGDLTIGINKGFRAKEANGAERRVLFNNSTSGENLYMGHIDAGWGAGLLFNSGQYINFAVNNKNSVLNAMRINTDGNVGIGTPTPAHKFQVHSANTPTIAVGKAAESTNGKSLVQFYAGTGASLWNTFKVQYNKSSSSDRLSFIDGGNVEALSLLNGGNVGIGTTTPKAKLDVNGESVFRTPAAGGIAMSIRMPNETNSMTLRGTSTTGEIHVQNNRDFALKDSQGKLILYGKHGGNVGIGTTNPEVKLDVREITGDGVINKISMASRRQTATSTDVASYDTALLGSVIGYGIPENKTDSGYKVAINASAFSNYNNFAGTLNTNYGLFARAGIRVGAPNAKINNAAAVYAELLTSAANTTITNGYGVKINTNGTGATNVINRYDLYAGTATAKNYFAGKVGIGTSTPAHKLDVNLTSETNFKTYDYGSEVKVETSGGWARSNRFTNGTQNSKTVAFGVESGNAFIATGFDSSTDQTGYQNQKLSILGNGNVGIGATTPDAKLTIKNGTQLVNFLVNKKLTGTWPPVAENATVTMQSSGTIAGNLAFATGNAERMRIANNGNVGIGTTNPGAYKLAVKGKIHTQEVKVDMIGWSDFVFEKDYSLPTLKEVAQHIQEKGHLKDIPSAKEVAKNGIFLGEMDAKLLQKIEELTLYTLEQEEKIQQLEKQNATLTDLSEKMLVLQARLEKIEAAKK